MSRRSIKSWLAGRFDARYVKRSEFDKVLSRLETTQADARSALRLARESGQAIESLLTTELELRQEIDTITGAGL